MLVLYCIVIHRRYEQDRMWKLFYNLHLIPVSSASCDSSFLTVSYLKAMTGVTSLLLTKSSQIIHLDGIMEANWQTSIQIFPLKRSWSLWIDSSKPWASWRSMAVTWPLPPDPDTGGASSTTILFSGLQWMPSKWGKKLHCVQRLCRNFDWEPLSFV